MRPYLHVSTDYRLARMRFNRAAPVMRRALMVMVEGLGVG